MLTLTYPLDWSWKTTPKWPLTLWNSWIGDVFFHVSWCVQWPNHWIGLEKLPQNDPWHFEIRPLDQKLWRCLFSCQLICTVTSPLDWPWKTTPKGPLICLNLSIGSKVMERSSSMSADVYSDLTIGLALKNYPKMTPHMLKSVHWFKSYGEVFFHVSWCVQWPDHWIGLEKLPQNDPSYAKICPLVPELWCGEWSVLSYSSPLIFHPCGGI